MLIPSLASDYVGNLNDMSAPEDDDWWDASIELEDTFQTALDAAVEVMTNPAYKQSRLNIVNPKTRTAFGSWEEDEPRVKFFSRNFDQFLQDQGLLEKCPEYIFV